MLHKRNFEFDEAKLRVSVVIAAYNKYKYISRSLQSILDQDLPCPFEIVICDDGSDDQTPLVAAEFAARDPRIRLVTHNSNLGPSIAQQAAYEASTGDLIFTFDADDILLPGSLGLLVRLLEYHGTEFAYAKHCTGHDEAGLLQFDDSSTNVEVIKDPFDRHLRRQYGSMVGLYTRDFFERIGGFDARVFIQDLPLIRKVAAQARDGIVLERLCSRSPAGSKELSINADQKQFDVLLSEVLFRTEYIDSESAFNHRKYDARMYRAMRHLEGQIGSRTIYNSKVLRYLNSPSLTINRAIQTLIEFADIRPVRLTQFGKLWLDSRRSGVKPREAKPVLAARY